METAATLTRLLTKIKSLDLGPNSGSQDGVDSRKSRDRSKIIKLDEVNLHDRWDDCWIVVYDFVYDCTEFLRSHPGGADIIFEYAGRDATFAFTGTGHSKHAAKILEKYKIGELPVDERIFRINGGFDILLHFWK